MKNVLVVGVLLFVGGFTLAQRSGSSFVNERQHEGEVITADLPGEYHMKNIGSKLDGAGMCVFTSLEHAAIWQGLDEFRGFRDWCAQKYPGGGYPSKVDKLIDAYCKAKNIDKPPYFQWEGRDPEKVMELIDGGDRMACITYGYSPRYGGTIAHMVNSVKYGQKWGVILDNNFPKSFEWMSNPELVKRMKHGSGSAWIFVWLAPPPPPMPK